MYCPMCCCDNFAAFEVEAVHTVLGGKFETECPDCGCTLLLQVEVMRAMRKES
jgi:hypothetical protein